MIKTDICVIGAGSGGLSVAAGAVQMGAKVVLCEGSKMGGDCLNYGCVPSKAMIEASRVIANIQKAKNLGIEVLGINADYKKIQQHVKSVIAKIEPHDSVERFEGLGVEVIQDFGEVVDSHTVKAGDKIIKAKYIVIATGSSASIPPINGLNEVEYLTNETIFEVADKPKHLLVIGGGPIGIELAQAHVLLGCEVTVFEVSDSVLTMVEKDCREIVISELKSQGIKIITKADIEKVVTEKNEKVIYCNGEKFTGSDILVAAGRKPNLSKLGLDDANINYTQKGIVVDNRLRTNHKNIFAIGDVTGGYQFTHVAGYQAGIVIQNVLFKLPAKVGYTSLPWSIYTTPEIAHVGISIEQAIKQGAKILEISYSDNDRAQAGLDTKGLVKVAVDKKGYILSATIVGKSSSELITQWTIAIKNKLKIKAMTSHIVAYPTLSELNKRVAGSYFTPTLYSPKVKKIVRFMMKVFGKKIC